MSLDGTRATMTKYINSHHSDVSMMAKDVVFTTMATGQEHKGHDGVSEMLNYFYHIAFDADFEPISMIFSENKALYEGTFVGKHIGEFAGVPATNKNVRVPLCIVYDLENDQIKRARVYFEMPMLFQQVGVS